MAATGEIERAREFWDRVFREATHDERAAPGGRDISGIIGRLRTASAVDVLDLGCGFGRWSAVLARAGFRVLAVDVSSEAVRIVRERAQRDGLVIGTAVSAAQDLSQLGVQVDAVVCNSVLDHMRPPDAQRSAENIAQVLKPGGLAYVSFDGLDKNDTGPEARKDYLIGADGTWEYAQGRRRGMVWRYYKDAEIRSLFREFEIDEFYISGAGQRRAWFRKVSPGNSR